MPVLVKMPKWGLMMKAGTVTEWLHGEGDAVAAGEPLFVVETDKTVNDVDAPADGVLRRIVAAAGTEVPVSGAVAVIAAPGEELTDDAVDAFVAAQAPVRASGTGTAGATRAARAPRPAAQGDDGRVRASPAARKRARELGIDLAAVTATGADGRVTSDDVERAAAEAGGDVRERWLPLAAGTRVHVLAGGPEDGAPVVFIHGIGGSASTWQGVIGAFAGSHHVLALDLPAHGQSDVPGPDADLTVDGLAGVVDDVLAQLGLDGVTLVGHSLGGGVALATAHASSRVARLVLVDATGLGAEIDAEVGRLLAAPPGLATSRALLERFFADPTLVLDAGVAEHHAALARDGAHAAIGAIATAAFDGGVQRASQLDRLAGLDVPVLVLWGEHDRVVPVDHAEAARAARPDAEVVVVPEAGHAPQLERPEAFVAALARFMAG